MQRFLRMKKALIIKEDRPEFIKIRAVCSSDSVKKMKWQGTVVILNYSETKNLYQGSFLKMTNNPFKVATTQTDIS